VVAGAPVSAAKAPPCRERGCKAAALADFVVCYEHVAKDALMGYANDLRAARAAGRPGLPPETTKKEPK